MSNTLVILTTDEEKVENHRNYFPHVIHYPIETTSLDADMLSNFARISMTEYFFVLLEGTVNYLSDLTEFKPTKHDKKYVHIFNHDRSIRLYNRLEVFRDPAKYADDQVLNPKNKLLKNHDKFYDIDIIDSVAVPIVEEGIKESEESAKNSEFYYILRKGYDMPQNPFSSMTIHPKHKYFLRDNPDYYISFPIVNNQNVVRGNSETPVGYGGLTLHRNGNTNEKESRALDQMYYYAPRVSYEPFDIFYICYDEPFKYVNFYQLTKRFGERLKLVDGIDGIPEAHIECAKQSETPYFYVIDADCRLSNSFDLDEFYPTDHLNVYVWKARNPLTGDTYGYGGVKLMSKEILNIYDPNKKYTDFATTIANGKFKSMPNISNETTIDHDCFTAWRSAFRETAKLVSNNMLGKGDRKTKKRIKSWLNIEAKDEIRRCGRLGARMGKEYAEETNGEIPQINDFDWIKSRYELLTVEQS